MDLHALTILADDPLARRMAATWPAVNRRWRGAGHPAVIERWAALSGVPASIVVRKAAVLFALDILGRDRTIAPAASTFLARYAVEGSLGRQPVKVPKKP